MRRNRKRLTLSLLLCLVLLLCACGEPIAMIGSHWNERGELVLEMSDGSILNAGSPTDAVEDPQGLAFHELPDGTWGVSAGTADQLLTLTVPATHRGEPVTMVMENGFAGAAVRKITLPDSITEIGAGAFSGSALITVELPAALETIGEDAFGQCYGLVRVSLPATLVKIGTGAFSSCPKLVEVENRSALKLTAGQSDHGYVAYNAQNIYTPKEGESKLSVTADGYVFLDVKRCFLMGYTGTQTALTLPADCDGKPYNVYRCAFYGMAELTEVVVPEGVGSVGERAFMNCTALRSVKLPQTLTRLGGYAFAECRALRELTLPAAPEAIDYAAFYHCDGIKHTEGNVVYVGTVMIDIVDNTAPFTLRADTTAIFQQAFYRAGVGPVILPEGVLSIGAEAFYLTKAELIYVPASVTYLDTGAFTECRNVPIYYGGGVENSALWRYVSLTQGTELYYYSEQAPTVEGNFWHYDAEGNMQVW